MMPRTRPPHGNLTHDSLRVPIMASDNTLDALGGGNDLDVPRRHAPSKKPTTSPPAASSADQAPPIPTSPCDAASVRPAAQSIAQSASTIVQSINAQQRSTLPRQLLKWTRNFFLLAGGTLALEQYLAARHDADNVRVENQLSAATEALASSDPIVQANAVRIIARISDFSTYAGPEAPAVVPYFVRHLRALFGYAVDYPYYDQSWLIMRDFAASRVAASRSSLVSSEILREAAQWEHRARQRSRSDATRTKGSLLFRAQLQGAEAYDLDLHGIQFGDANLRLADLSGSDCSGCGLLGASIDRATLRGAVFEAAYLAEANMSGADLSFARLSKAVLQGARLEDVRFLQSDLADADLSDAKLDGSLFSQVDLTGTDFSRSSLRGVRFVQTDVSTAIFAGADVEGADFTRSLGFSRELMRMALNTQHAVIPTNPESTR